MTKDKANGKLIGGRIRERRIRKKALDLERGRGLYLEGKRRNQEGEKGCKISLWVFNSRLELLEFRAQGPVNLISWS
jgi:hypothetical protein